MPDPLPPQDRKRRIVPTPTRLQPGAPAPSPPGPRVYARVHRFELACPRCGDLAVPRTQGKRTGVIPGWYPERSLWRCPGCGYQAFVGVVLWPAPGSRRAARPLDHVLTPSEAAELRLTASWAVPSGHGEGDRATRHRRRRRVNLRCTCGEACPVHDVEFGLSLQREGAQRGVEVRGDQPHTSPEDEEGG